MARLMKIVTLPTREMIDYMSNATMGDDVYSEDKTVLTLQEKVADLTGTEAALFCVSGTMSNQIAIQCHLTQSPHSMILDRQSHIYQYEAGGLAYHSRTLAIPIDPSHRFLSVSDIKKHIILDTDIHHAPTRLISLENTMNGEIYPFSQLKHVSDYAKRHHVRLHLDGARLWNASVQTGIPLKEYCQLFDTTSLCLSKGLGAPIGSLLVGKRSLIEKANHYRKLMGGGWRQAGMLAAAGLYAIQHHWPALTNDHENAKYLGERLSSIGCTLTKQVDTNMVWFDTKSLPKPFTMDQMEPFFKEQGIKVFNGNTTEGRLVVHHQTPRPAIDHFLHVFEKFVALL